MNTDQTIVTQISLSSFNTDHITEHLTAGIQIAYNGTSTTIW